MLAEISRINAHIARDEAKLDTKVQELREKLTVKHVPFTERKQGLEVALKSFCDSRRDVDFKQTRTKSLPNGDVYFRIGNPFVSLLAKSWDEVVGLIKKSKYRSRFIRITEQVDKREILASVLKVGKGNVSASDLEELGMKIEREESWGYKAGGK